MLVRHSLTILPLPLGRNYCWLVQFCVVLPFWRDNPGLVPLTLSSGFKFSFFLQLSAEISLCEFGTSVNSLICGCLSKPTTHGCFPQPWPRGVWADFFLFWSPHQDLSAYYLMNRWERFFPDSLANVLDPTILPKSTFGIDRCWFLIVKREIKKKMFYVTMILTLLP